jgi:integrase
MPFPQLLAKVFLIVKPPYLEKGRLYEAHQVLDATFLLGAGAAGNRPAETSAIELERKTKTHASYETCLRNLLPWFGAQRLSEISADTIAEFKESRLTEGRRGTTVNRDLACLRRVLSVAIKRGLIDSSPFTAHRVEFLPENRRERVLTFAEEKAYLKVAKQPLHDVALIMLDVGLRPEEVFTLHSQHVHLVASSYLHIPDGKTANARRDVPITQRALPVIRRRLSQAEGGYLFPLRVGNVKGRDRTQPMTTVQKARENAMEESGIKSVFRLYDLRHTYGTRAIEAGTDPLTLAKLMGHADLKTTQRYVHLSKRHLVQAQVRMEQFRAEREIAEAEATAGLTAGVQ